MTRAGILMQNHFFPDVLTNCNSVKGKIYQVISIILIGFERQILPFRNLQHMFLCFKDILKNLFLQRRKLLCKMYYCNKNEHID